MGKHQFNCNSPTMYAAGVWGYLDKKPVLNALSREFDPQREKGGEV